MSLAFTESVSAGSVAGGLRLRVEGDGEGRSRILEQRYAAPVHVGKAYGDPAGLYLQMMSPSAGMMDGDCLQVDVEVTQAGRVCLYAPAINKVYASCHGGEGSSCQQRFAVSGVGSFLEWVNEGSLLQADARYDQQTEVHLGRDAEMIYYDILWPGRLARGEAFQFAAYQSAMKVYRQGRCCALEKMYLQQGNRAMQSWERVMGPSLMATIYVLTTKDLRSYLERIHQWHDDDCWLGATPLRGGGLMIRALARAPIYWKRVRRELRVLFGEMLQRPLVDMRVL